MGGRRPFAMLSTLAVIGISASESRPAHADQDASGFAITLDGKPFLVDQSVPRSAVDADTDAADRRLDARDIRVQFDGLAVEPRLHLEIVRDSSGRLLARTETNYPAFIDRGEVRLIDLTAPSGARTVMVLPMPANGVIELPGAPVEGLVAVYRVHDFDGRRDETRPVPLRTDDAVAIGRITGRDLTTRRDIPIAGGAVTVSGRSAASGGRIRTLGENVTPDASGSFAIQRILPPGPHDISVRLEGAGASDEILRRVDVPRNEFFYVGSVDLTFGRRFDEGAANSGYAEGRLAFFIDGVTAGRTRITARADTGLRALEDLFSDLDAIDPRETILRVDPDDLYPTYGDDSVLVDRAPTRGKFYLKVERDSNYAVWGNSRLAIDGNAFLRGQRMIYGGHVHSESRSATKQGDARASADIYAAQNDQMTRGDVLRGTGGSVYFLSRQDLVVGSETILVELRNALTGQVLETRSLVAGEDYEINYYQGVITLRRPLSGTTGSAAIVRTRPSGDTVVNLLARYDYAPSAGDLDDFSFGGRAEVWASDALRFGAAATSDQTSADADQTAAAFDLFYRFGGGSFVRLDHARTDGPGIDQAFSLNGGLGFEDRFQGEGHGAATRAELSFDLADLSIGVGTFDVYRETRDVGFTTFDTAVTVATGDEDLYGFSAELHQSARLVTRMDYDEYRNEAGKRDRDAGFEASYVLAPTLTLGAGIAHVERSGDELKGNRTDLAARLEIASSEALSYYGFAQATLERTGDLERNDRIGGGLAFEISSEWSLEGEVSAGNLGTAAEIRLGRDQGREGNTYLGFALVPGQVLTDRSTPLGQAGSDRSRLVAGRARQVNDALRMFGENRHELFGDERETASIYGVDYAMTKRLDATTTLEVGRVDATSERAQISRRALTFGLRFAGDALTTSGRLEYRDDDSNDAARDGEVFVLTGDLGYRISESQRLLANFDAVESRGGITSLADGDFVDASIGYALRPIDGDTMNLLLRYRFLNDEFGQRVDGSDSLGPVQHSQLFSVDANYDLTSQFTLGVKFGVRLGETAPDRRATFKANDARILVLNGRYVLNRKWDALLELRSLDLEQAQVTKTGALGAVYRSVGPRAKIGLGYNAGQFSDDLADLTFDDRGVFVNVMAMF